jgi:hypothetical protein
LRDLVSANDSGGELPDETRREMANGLRGKVSASPDAIFGIAATEREMRYAAAALAWAEAQIPKTVGENREIVEKGKTSGGELESLRSEVARLREALAASEAREALSANDLRKSHNRIAAGVALASAAEAALCGGENESFNFANGLRNSLVWAGLDRDGKWSARSVQLPTARLEDLESFELPRDHFAFSAKSSRGVRVKAGGQRIAVNETICYYAGIVRPGHLTDASDYPFDLTNGLRNAHDPVVDALHLGNVSRFLNAAWGASQLPPNCAGAFENLNLGGKKMRCVRIVAVREVAPGEELLLDYGAQYWHEKANRDRPKEELISALAAFRAAAE